MRENYEIYHEILYKKLVEYGLSKAIKTSPSLTGRGYFAAYGQPATAGSRPMARSFASNAPPR